MELVPGLFVETFKADNYFITNGNKSWETNGIKIVSDNENTKKYQINNSQTI